MFVFVMHGVEIKFYTQIIKTRGEEVYSISCFTIIAIPVSIEVKKLFSQLVTITL